MTKKLIYLEDALDALAEESYHNEEDYRTAVKAIGGLPSAQPEKRAEERAETHACDLIDRQAAIDARMEDGADGI